MAVLPGSSRKFDVLLFMPPKPVTALERLLEASLARFPRGCCCPPGDGDLAADLLPPQPDGETSLGLDGGCGECGIGESGGGAAAPPLKLPLLNWVVLGLVGVRGEGTDCIRGSRDGDDGGEDEEDEGEGEGGGEKLELLDELGTEQSVSDVCTESQRIAPILSGGGLGRWRLRPR